MLTVVLHWSTNQPRPTGGQLQEFNKAIRYMRNINDFYLMTQYTTHTNQTVAYMQKYLQGSYETKDVFLRFRVDKKTKRSATAAY